jgi:hypothetical protein
MEARDRVVVFRSLTFCVPFRRLTPSSCVTFAFTERLWEAGVTMVALSAVVRIRLIVSEYA